MEVVFYLSSLGYPRHSSPFLLPHPAHVFFVAARCFPGAVLSLSIIRIACRLTRST